MRTAITFSEIKTNNSKWHWYLYEIPNLR